MQHAIKINRAHKLAPMLPMADREIMSVITPSLLDSLTSAELAEVKKILDTHWHKATAFTERRIIDDGYVWSEKHQQLLDIKF